MTFMIYRVQKFDRILVALGFRNAFPFRLLHFSRRFQRVVGTIRLDIPGMIALTFRRSLFLYDFRWCSGRHIRHLGSGNRCRFRHGNFLCLFYRLLDFCGLSRACELSAHDATDETKNSLYNQFGLSSFGRGRDKSSGCSIPSSNTTKLMALFFSALRLVTKRF